MIIKERINIVLISGLLIVGVYSFLFIATPGYMLPLWNFPFANFFMIACLVLFCITSVMLLLAPKPRTDGARIALGFYVAISVAPNLIMPLLGAIVFQIVGCNF